MKNSEKKLVIVCGCGQEYAFNFKQGLYGSKEVGERCGTCLGRSNTQYDKWRYCGRKLKEENIRELRLVDGLWKTVGKKKGE